MSLSLDRVIQVVMDDLVYYPYHFVEKLILSTLGRIARSYALYAGKENFFTIPTVFALESPIEINCFKMEWYSFCSYMGPNQERIMDQMVSRLSVWPQVSFIKTGSYKGIGQRLIGFRVFVSVVVRQCYRPRLIKLVKIWKPLLLLLRLRVRQRRCCVEPVIRSKKESLKCDRQLLQISTAFFITKYDTVYYKLR